MTKILFTGGGGAGNEALWRLLSNTYELYFGDADVDAINPIIPRDRRIALPWASAENFVGRIIDICRELKIDLLVPGVDEELLPLALEVGTLLPTVLFLPNKTYIETMIDKLSMIRNLEHCGVNTPSTQKTSEGYSGINFPCIAKPRRGRGSRGVMVLKNGLEAEMFLDSLAAKKEDYIFQDKCEGVEYTVQMIADQSGYLRAVVPVKVDIKRGITIRAVTEYNEVIIAECQKIHEVVPASGCYNIQLILTKDKKVCPFEINPRISTTFCMTVAAGIDPFKEYFKNGHESLIADFESGLKLQRHWTNHFLKG